MSDYNGSVSLALGLASSENATLESTSIQEQNVPQAPVLPLVTVSAPLAEYQGTSVDTNA